MMKIYNKNKVVILLVLFLIIFILSGCTMTPPDDSTTNITDVVPPVFEPSFTTPVPTIPPTQPPIFPQTTPPIALPTLPDNIWENNNIFPPTSNIDSEQTPSLSTTTPVSTIQTVPTTRPTSLPTSPPASIATASPAPEYVTLRKGSKGADVKTLQQRLKDLNYYSGSIDSDYGSGTVDAVKAFQRVNGLTVDGVAGQRTLKALFSVNAKKNTSTSASSTTKPTTKPTARPTSTPRPVTINPDKARYLTINMSGKDVTQLQNRLIALGYLTGRADGKYGYRTEAAVIAFQKRMRIWDDGIAGPDTQVKVHGSGAKKANSVVAHIGTSLKMGDDGAGIRSMQRKLFDLGYLKSHQVDGSFGENTALALSSFQKNNSLKVDSIGGSNTLEKLFSPSAIKSDGTGGSTSSDKPASSGGYTTLRLNDSGQEVKKLQDKLKTMGTYSGSSDGKFGSATEEAVKKFQLINGLTVDGIAGPATQRLIYGDTPNNPTKYKALKPYDEGEAVKNLQYALYELKYYQGKINGIYNDATTLAVREFQTNNGLAVDGIAGSSTVGLLFSSYAKPAGKSTSVFKTLQLGDRNDDVYILNNRLKVLGYIASSVEVTNYYGETTRNAVKAFQAATHLAVDGIAGPETQQKLFASNAIPKN